MKVKEYFELYSSFKQETEDFRTFNFLQSKVSVMRYFKNHKKKIIESINYAFFESNEPYLLSVFSWHNARFVHINSTMTENYPIFATNVKEYENYLAIFGTFGILLDQNFRIEALDDSRICYCSDFLRDMTNRIYYDENFRLNLTNYIEQPHLKIIYRFGGDFVFEIFNAYYRKKLELSKIKDIFQTTEENVKELYALLSSKIVVGNNDE